jgi:mannose PTS system EIIA component
MIGIVVVAHGNLPAELTQTTHLILGREIPAVHSISIHPSDSTESVAEKIKKAIREVDDGDGVVIFTDMFGGTPSNVSLSFLEEAKVEVISGVNLPMMLYLATHREGASLREIGRILQSTGRENISLASDLLRDQES